jgi:hypothetical protein
MGVALFGGLFIVDSRGAQQRVEQRKAIRDAQIRSGDREVFVNDQGETMSRLKEVGGLAELVRSVKPLRARNSVQSRMGVQRRKATSCLQGGTSSKQYKQEGHTLGNRFSSFFLDMS